MRMPRRLALLVTLASAGAALALRTTAPSTSPPPPPASSPSTPLNWTACNSASDTSATDIITPPFSERSTSKTSSLIECTTIHVPVCYDGVVAACSSQTHSLGLSRLTTATAADAPTLWIAYDPRATGQSMSELMTRVTQFTSVGVNAYALESRLFTNIFLAGSDASKFTPCSSMVADHFTRPQIDTTLVGAIANCTAWIQSTLGDGGVQAYSLDSAARDLTLAMEIVHSQEKIPQSSPLYVYANSGATRVVQRMLSQTKGDKLTAAANTTDLAVTGVILDAPPPTPVAEKPVGDAMARFVGACASDPLCGSKFKNLSLPDTLTQIYALVDGDTVKPSTLFVNSSNCIAQMKTAVLTDARDPTASHGVRRLLARVLRFVSDGGPQAIPAFVYRVRRCADDDKAKLTAFYSEAYTVKSSPADAASSMARFVDTIVVASELWPTESDPTREQLAKAFEESLISDGLMLLQQPSYCTYSMSKSAACQALYKPGVSLNSSILLTYKPSTNVTDVSPFTDVDVLILASHLGGTGSSSTATQLYDTLLSHQSSAAKKHTLVMVQSDLLDEQQLGGTTSKEATWLTSAFLAGKARGLSGAWSSSDLARFDWISSPPSTNQTNPSAPASSVNFTISTKDSWEWFSWMYAYEESEPFRRSLDLESADNDWDVVYEYGLPFVAVVVICVGYAMIRFGCCYRMTRQPSPVVVGAYLPPLCSPQPEPPVPLAMMVPLPSAPDFPDEPLELHSIVEPVGIEPLEWEAEHVNKYTVSYTPRNSSDQHTTEM